jgi:hypothetical protein
MASEVTCRPFEHLDYEMVCDWWRDHGRCPIQWEFLPSCGYIAEDHSRPLAAAWLFFDTSTPTCFIGQAVSRPKLTIRETSLAFRVLIDRLKYEAVISRAIIMMAYVPNGIARYLPEFMEDQRSLANLSLVLKEEDICLGFPQ